MILRVVSRLKTAEVDQLRRPVVIDVLEMRRLQLFGGYRVKNLDRTPTRPGYIKEILRVARTEHRQVVG